MSSLPHSPSLYATVASAIASMRPTKRCQITLWKLSFVFTLGQKRFLWQVFKHRLDGLKHMFWLSVLVWISVSCFRRAHVTAFFMLSPAVLPDSPDSFLHLHNIPYIVPDRSSIMPLYSLDGLVCKPPSSTYGLHSLPIAVKRLTYPHTLVPYSLAGDPCAFGHAHSTLISPVQHHHKWVG